MRKIKKLTSVLLAVIMAFGVLTVAPFTVSAKNTICTQSQAVAWLKSQDGASYDFGNFYDGKGNYWGGTQCVEFVKAYVNWLMTGNAWHDVWNRPTLNGDTIWKNSLWNELGWTVYYNTADFMPQPGDIFSSGGCHTGVVISSDLNKAVVADSNARNNNPYDGDSVWIHTINWRSASSGATYGATHYIRPNFASNAPHTHNYNTYVYYWKSHPHYKCYKCSCGEVKENRNQTTFLPDCDQCNPSIDLGNKFNAFIVNANNKLVTVTNGNNVAIKSAQNTPYQQWTFERQSDLSYKIINSGTRLCLDVHLSNTKNGTNIQVYGDNGSNAQRWYIKRNSNGYALVPKCSKISALDLANNNSTDGTNIQLYEWNGTTAQQYKFDILPASVSLNQNSLTLSTGRSYTLTKTVSPSNASTSYTWSSSNTYVATVTSNGYVYAKNPGSATITVKTSNGKSDNCYVTVKPSTVSPSSVSLDKSSLTLGTGESYKLTKTVSPTNASTSYTWSSSNTSVATVSNGKVTAKKAGTAYITVRTSNGKTATCKVTVKPAPTSVKTNPANVTLGVGETYTISESTNSGTYANASNLKWSTSNSSVATVTKSSANKATITAKGVGTAYVKITLYNGKTAQCKVTVKPAPTSVKTNPASVTLGVGEKYTISESTNSGTYANASNLKWSTSNSSVATVTKGSGNKATITAKSKGTAYIKITLYNGKTAQCKVTVKPAPTSVKSYPASVTLGKGENYTIAAGTNSGSWSTTYTWSSSNNSVATVTGTSANKAKITAKGTGTATITIRTFNGKTATCKVTVKSAPSSVKVNPSNITLKKGASYTISESTNSGTYANASNLKWSTSNSSVATVTKGSGNKATITAKSKGTAYIKITLYNGKTAQCKVTVK